MMFRELWFTIRGTHQNTFQEWWMCFSHRSDCFGYSICDPVIEQILVNPLSVTWRFHMIAPLKQSIFLVMAFHLLLPLDRCFRQDELFYFVEWVIKENCKHLSSFNVVIGWHENESWRIEQPKNRVFADTIRHYLYVIESHYHPSFQLLFNGQPPTKTELITSIKRSEEEVKQDISWFSPPHWWIRCSRLWERGVDIHGEPQNLW